MLELSLLRLRLSLELACCNAHPETAKTGLFGVLFACIIAKLLGFLGLRVLSKVFLSRIRLQNAVQHA